MKTLIPICLAALLTSGPSLSQPVLIEPITCLLAPVKVSAIGSGRNGIVQAVNVERASRVEAGQVLVQLVDNVARSEFKVASITAQGLAARIERSEALQSSNLISVDEMENMRTELALAEAQIERAEDEIAMAQIKAPFSGYVASVLVSEGQLTSNEPLVELIDVTTLKAELVYFDTAFDEFKVGDEVQLFVDLVGQNVTAEIVSIDPYLDAASNTFTVIAHVPNEDLVFPAGTSCRVVN